MKPEWLVAIERAKRRVVFYCHDCLYYGDMVGETRHKGKQLVAVHECAIHSGCFNTEHSVGCSDWTSAYLV